MENSEPINNLEDEYVEYKDDFTGSIKKIKKVESLMKEKREEVEKLKQILQSPNFREILDPTGKSPYNARSDQDLLQRIAYNFVEGAIVELKRSIEKSGKVSSKEELMSKRALELKNSIHELVEKDRTKNPMDIAWELIEEFKKEFYSTNR